MIIMAMPFATEISTIRMRTTIINFLMITYGRIKGSTSIDMDEYEKS